MLVGTIIVFSILFIVVVTAFIGLDRFWSNSGNKRLSSIEAALKKAAVQCYALEGSFPPDLEYLRQNYGIVLDKKHYYYHYEIFASNIMPEIGVYKKDGKSGVAVDVQ